MTIIVALAILLLVGGIIVAILKKLFRLAVMFAGFALLLLGIAIFVIGSMH